jgi:hypothetical protein
MFRVRPRRFLSLLLAVSLALAPLFSAAHMGRVAAPDEAPVLSAGPHAHHLADLSVNGDQGDQDTSRCVTHDSCAGQCCVGCGHCVTTVIAVPVPAHPNHPVQTPVVLTLHLSDLPAVQNRPPQV